MPRLDLPKGIGSIRENRADEYSKEEETAEITTNDGSSNRVKSFLKLVRDNPGADHLTYGGRLGFTEEQCKHILHEHETSQEEGAEVEDESLYREVASFDFPADANEKAFYGIAGKITRIICDGTENKPEAVLAQFLGIFGNIVGRGLFKYQDKRHGTALNVAVVGATAGGAKGSSLSAVKDLFYTVDTGYCDEKFTCGHNSAEAILEEIRDTV